MTIRLWALQVDSQDFLLEESRGSPKLPVLVFQVMVLVFLVKVLSIQVPVRFQVTLALMFKVQVIHDPLLKAPVTRVRNHKALDIQADKGLVTRVQSHKDRDIQADHRDLIIQVQRHKAQDIQADHKVPITQARSLVTPHKVGD